MVVVVVVVVVEGGDRGKTDGWEMGGRRSEVGGLGVTCGVDGHA